MTDTIQTIAGVLKQVHSCRIFYHIKPDGDAVGSSHALALALQSLGTECELLCDSPMPKIYLPLVSQVPVQKIEAEGCFNISVDSASSARLGCYGKERIDICIDHHENNSIEAEHKVVDPGSASCAEIVYQIIQEMDIQITPLMADLLYTGVLTDASCFRSVSTRPETLMHAAQIAAHGADIAGIGRRHFLKKSPGRIKIESILQNHFRYSCGGKILSSYLTLRDYAAAGIEDSETEGLNELMDQVDGTDMAIVVRENKPGVCRISVRANKPYSAVPVCVAYGGAGHDHAAGCVLECGVEEAVERIEEACREYWETVGREE